MDMRKSERKEEIRRQLWNKPHLKVMESNVLHIPERLYEYDPDLFVVFNIRSQKYEIHSLANKGNTHCVTVPWNQLDVRAIELFAKGDQRRRSFKEIIREIDEYNEKLERRHEKYRRDELNAMAREVRPVFKRLAEEVY
jgi:hypothetical protein